GRRKAGSVNEDTHAIEHATKPQADPRFPERERGILRTQTHNPTTTTTQSNTNTNQNNANVSLPSLPTLPALPPDSMPGNNNIRLSPRSSAPLSPRSRPVSAQTIGGMLFCEWWK